MTSEVSVLKDENTWTESKLNDITNGKHCKATANVSIKRSLAGDPCLGGSLMLYNVSSRQQWRLSPQDISKL